MRLLAALPCLLLGLVLLFLGSGASAAPPMDMSYQGRLLDTGGNPLAGPVDVEIGVGDQSVAGNRLYGETHLGVTLNDGVFGLLLGTGTVLQGSFDAGTASATPASAAT